MLFIGKNVLEYLNDGRASTSDKEIVFEQKKKKVIKEIKQLTAKEIVDYLFKSRLPKNVKRLICSEIDKLAENSDEDSKKKLDSIKDYFVGKKLYSEELLGSNYCPVALKRCVIERIYSSSLVDVICRKNLSTAKKKTIIDLALSTNDAIVLLGRGISDDLKDYIIDTRIVDDSVIKRCIEARNVPDKIREKVINRKVNIGNIFKITRYCLLEQRKLVFSLKDRELDDYINSLTDRNILNLINTYDTPSDFVDKVLVRKFDVVKKAIETCDIKELAEIVRFERDQRLIELVIQKRNKDLYEIIRKLEPRNLLSWLNREYLPLDIKDYIIDYHKDVLLKEISNVTVSRADFYYLNVRGHLPYEIKQRIFDVCKKDFEMKFMRFSASEVLDKIKFGGYDELLNSLLIDLRVNKNNIVGLLEDSFVDDEIVNRILSMKADVIRGIISELSLEEVLTLNKFKFKDDVKNRFLEIGKDLVADKLNVLDKETLYGYLGDESVLFSAKRRILECFGLYEEDLHNILDVLTKENVGFLVEHYSEIKEFIKGIGIDFQSFIQYGSASKKYSDWLVNLTRVIDSGKINEFINVKNYFFSNYYNEYLEKENAVYTILSFLELLNNYCRYNELCVRLANDNVILNDNDRLNIGFLFSIKEVEGLDVPKTLDDLSSYRRKLYEDVVNKIESNLCDENQLKQIFNDLVFGHADEILYSIGGTGALRTLKKDNANSLEISDVIDEMMLYSRIIELVNDTNNVDGLKKVLKYVFSDIDTLMRVQNLFLKFENNVTKLYEADSRNNLTSLNKVRLIPGVIDCSLSDLYGGEVFDFSDKNYVLYAHVLSSNEDIEAILDGRASGKRNFISVSPISYKGQKYYWDRSECILAFDTIPKGSFICSSIYNMGTNSKVTNNSSEVDQFNRKQRGILETSSVTLNNSEALFYREKLKPCGLILPGGRKPTAKELEFHKKYNLPFIITQEVEKSIENPKMVFDGNGDIKVKTIGGSSELLDMMNILEPSVVIDKETDVYTGREVALFTDSHSMYEPTLAVLEDMRRHGITEIYSLGDNVGLGPNPSEVFDLLEEYGVISIAGNSEYYSTLGVEPFEYFYDEKVKSQEWTANKLGRERISKLKLYPASVDLMMGNKKLALCHFINDVRWDYRDRSVHTYRANFKFGESSRQFEFTNSDEAKKKVNDCITSYKKGDKCARGYLSAKNEPLFDGKKVTDYDAVIQGHSHFDMIDILGDTEIYTLRAVGMGYENDPNDSACYYVLKEKKDGTFDIEKRLVNFNRNSLLSSIHTSDIPDKGHVLEYVMSGGKKEFL